MQTTPMTTAKGFLKEKKVSKPASHLVQEKLKILEAFKKASACAQLDPMTATSPVTNKSGPDHKFYTELEICAKWYDEALEVEKLLGGGP